MTATGTNRHERYKNLRFLICAAFAALTLAAPAQAATGGISGLGLNGGAGASSQGISFSPMRIAGATWYGPGLYGNRTACGRVLGPRTIGVAHRRLPCGTPVKFAYRGRYLVTTVIDRGPFTRGHAWDLTNGARRILGFEGSNRVRYAIARNFAKR